MTLGERFSNRDVRRVTGVTGRQLSYWAQTGVVVPSARTAGGHSRYDFRDLIALKAAKRLIDSGVSLQRIRHSLAALAKFLPTVKKPLTELALVATGDLVLVFHAGAAFEAVSGQEWVYTVAELQRDVDRVRGVRPQPVQRELFAGAGVDGLGAGLPGNDLGTNGNESVPATVPERLRAR